MFHKNQFYFNRKNVYENFISKHRFLSGSWKITIYDFYETSLDALFSSRFQIEVHTIYCIQK